MFLLFLGVLLTVYSFYTRKKYNPIFGVALIFIVMGFQSNVMSDYQNYMNDYTFVQTSGRLVLRTAESEPVWAALFWIFSQQCPFWVFIMVLAAVQSYILYLFIAKYCKNGNQWLAVVLFYFTFNMMLLQMYVIRQSLAIAIVILAFIIVDQKKKPIIPLVIFVLAYLIHNSSIVALPFLILYYYNNRRIKEKEIVGQFGKLGLSPFIMFGLFVVVYFLKDIFLNQYLVPLSMAFDDDFRLASYLNKDNANGMQNEFTISPLIALYDGIIVFFATWFFKNSSRKMQAFCIMSISVAFGDMLLFGIGSLPRVLMYIALFNLPVYTSMTTQIRKKYGELRSLIFIALLLGYAIKTSLPWFLGTDGDQFGNYKFIFMP